MSAKFGPAGNSNSFTQMGYKGSLQVPEYLERMGLDAFEYQCGRGVNIGEDKACELGRLAAKKGITLSLHAPYYISMSSVEEEKRLNSINYILSSARAVDDNENLGHIHICPETMGKVNQLGTLDEVLALCKIDERLIPCIDFGHLNARDLGYFKTKQDYKTVFDKIENALGYERLCNFHSHFSKIEYTTGGEKRHLTFEDTVYGPDFEPVIDLVVQKNCSPTFICESDGTQAEDVKQMKDYYNSLLK